MPSCGFTFACGCRVYIVLVGGATLRSLTFQNPFPILCVPPSALFTSLLFASLLGVNVRDSTVNETTTEAAAATVAASRKANAASYPTMASSENDQGEGDVAAAATLTASTPPVVAVVESDGSVIDVTGDGGATDTSGSSHAGEAAGDDTVDASDSGKPPPQSPSPDAQPSSLNDEDRALMAEFMDAADEVLDEFEDCRLPDVQPCRAWRVCPHLMPFIAVGCVH